MIAGYRCVKVDKFPYIWITRVVCQLANEGKIGNDDSSSLVDSLINGWLEEGENNG